MHGGSSRTHKETLSRTHLHQTRPYRSLRHHAARWVRWTLTVGMAPALPTCGRRKNSCIKRHPHPLLRRVRARRRYPRRKLRVPMVEATGGARMTSRRCAPRGACAVVTIVGTRVRTGRRTGKGSTWTMTTTTMAQEICAWRARSRTRGSADIPFHLQHLAASITPLSSFLPHFSSLSPQTHLFPRPCLFLTPVSAPLTLLFRAPPVLSLLPCLPCQFFHLSPLFSFSFPFFLMHYIAHVHVVPILNTLNI
ncbi:hypothetical protein EDB83DRAFT_2291586 [Lactarius deliciosus]|nr:hypothetical protein EDB83DRAFT_2291586 [Lactarius deliciosus]